MKAIKYRFFEVEFNNGETVVLKAPVSKLAVKTAEVYAPHWYTVQLNAGEIFKVVNIKGIK